MTWRGLLASWATALTIWLGAQTGDAPAGPGLLALLIAAAPAAWIIAGRVLGDDR